MDSSDRALPRVSIQGPLPDPEAIEICRRVGLLVCKTYYYHIKGDDVLFYNISYERSNKDYLERSKALLLRK